MPMQPFSPTTFKLTGQTITIGRDRGCALVVTGTGVSREHARLHLVAPQPVIRDNASTFGTRINDLPVAEQTLCNGDEMVIGVARMRVELRAGTITFHPVVESNESVLSAHDTSAGEPVLIGRDSSCTIQCNHPLVSRFHATLIAQESGDAVLVDHQSANGTWVNGHQVKRCAVTNGDIVQIGPFRFLYDNHELIQADDVNRVRIEAFGLTVRRGSELILRDMSLCVHPGEFTAILGPSGAGKSTLAYALTGQVPLERGRIFLNGLPFSTFWASFRSSVGFVAQTNLLHEELTVHETFHEQSLLRLPGDNRTFERSARIGEVLELLELTTVRNNQIRHLSGGQAKRVHLGIELLSSPPLIVLDEPLAGLDSGLVGSFMTLFRTICDKGHTILMATHALEQIELCDRVLFVSGGAVRYAGPPSGLAPAFGVVSMAAVYDAVKKTPPQPSAQPQSGGVPGEADSGSLVKIRRQRGAGALRQLPMLCRRYSRILLRDPKSLGALLVQPVLIALLLLMVFGGELSFFPLTFYFCLTVSCVWIGGIASVRAIARDSLLLVRESRAGLSVGAYLVSQLCVYGLVALVQSLLFALCLRVAFVHLGVDWALTMLLLAGCVGGVLLGLAVSVVSATVNRAVSWLPVIFIPQIFFSGILVPFDRMTWLGSMVSKVTVARWVFALFKKLRVLDEPIWSMGDWQGLAALLSGICIFVFIAGQWRFGGTRPRQAGE